MQWVPANASVVVHGAGLLPAVQGVWQFSQRLGEAAGGSEPQRELAARLGFDPSTVEGLTQAGADGQRPFALAHVGDAWVWVLPATDATTLTETVVRLAGQLDGATRSKTVTVQGVAATVLSRPFGQREVQRAAVAQVPGHVLVSIGAAPQTLLEAVLSPQFVAMGRVPASPAPIQFVSHPERVQEDTVQAARNIVAVLEGDLTPNGSGVTLNARWKWNPSRAGQLHATLFPAGPPLPLPSLVQDDALVVGQGGLMWEKAAGVANSVSPGSVASLTQLAAQAGLHVDEGFMALTDGHLGGAIYLQEPGMLAAQLATGIDIRSALLRVLPFVVVVRPRPGATPSQLVQRFAAIMKTRGFAVNTAAGPPQITEATQPGGPKYRRYRAAIHQGLVLLSAGQGDRLERALASAGTAPTLERAAEIQIQDSSVVRLRFSAAAAQLATLMAQDLGAGADALTLRAVLGRVHRTLLRLEVAQGTLSAEPNGAALTLQLTYKPKGP